MGKRVKLAFKKKVRVMISKRERRSSSKSVKKLEQLPLDLIIDILSKLPMKSIARLRCVSRNWSSFLRSPDFTNLFLTVSSSRPRFLFAVYTKGSKCFFFSAPQPLNSSSLVVDYHMTFTTDCSSLLHAPVNGFLCTANAFKRGRNINSKVMIYNPSTRQSIPLPIMRGEGDDPKTFFGYDPINKQYKVLCMSMRNRLVIEYQVLTLGIKKPDWRMIESSLPQHFPCSPICINGVLYYKGDYRNIKTLVCFDVRSEKFKLIEADDKVTRISMLINYKGKLGVLPRTGYFYRETKSIELLVLKDVEKNEWSQHIYVLPPLWKDLVKNMMVYIVGMTGNGELVFSSESYVYGPFYIFFYNVERNTIARVRIQGMESSRHLLIQTFTDHVENVKLM